MSKPRFIFTLKLEAMPGTDVLQAAVEAQRLADQLGVCVEYDFNGVSCNARPGGRPEQLAETVMARMGTASGRRVVFS